MAFYGFSRPWIGTLDITTGTYSNVARCSSGMSTSITPNFSSASLYADDRQKIKVDEFLNATVELGVDEVPISFANVLFGHTVTGGTEVSNADDRGSFVGYGFIAANMKETGKTYRACFLHKVQFNEGADNYTTKGETLTFNTPVLNATAFALENGVWRTKSPEFSTKADADAWIQEMFGVVQPVTPSIELDNDTASVNVGDTVTIAATTVPEDATVTWVSADTTIATVNDGVITGVAAGTTTITASIEVGEQVYNATCTVTVAGV